MTVASIKRITPNLELKIPEFDSPLWGRYMEQNLDILDTAVFGASTAHVVITADGPPFSASSDSLAVKGQLWWESDSGRLYVWYDDGDSAQWVQIAGSQQILLGGSASGDFITPQMFGAVADGVTDDTAAVQACADYCKDNNLSATIPGGTYVVTNVTFYGPINSSESAVFISPNSVSLAALPVITVAPRPEDVVDIPMATLNTWTGIVKGSTKHANFVPYYGKTVWWYSNDERIIVRHGIPTMLQLQDCISVHDPDGSFYPPIMTSKTIPWASASGSAITNRERIVVTLPTVRFVGSSSGERGTGVLITRPNTTVMGAHVENTSTTPIQQGFVAQVTSEVSFISCSVKGLQENTTNYGFSNGRTAGTTFIDCHEIYCRRGLDGTAAKKVRVIGGSYPDGVGAHWVDDLHVSGGAYIASDAPNAAPINVSGGNVSVHSCTIKVRYDQYAVFTVRGDFFEMSGSVRIEDCDIEIDCTVDTTNIRTLLNFGVGATDPGRLIYLPKLISFKGNRIKQIGASWTGKCNVLTLVTANATQPSGISAGGDVFISGNHWDFDAGTMFDATNPRLVIQSFKPPSWRFGTGYNIRIEDIPDIQVYMWCDPAHPSPTVAPRNNLYGRNLGYVMWQGGYGAFRYADFDAKTSSGVIGLGRPIGGYATPVGDEVEIVNRAFYGFKTWDPPSMANGTFTDTTVNVVGAKGGDFVLTPVFSGGSILGVPFEAKCLADGVVSIRMTNNTGGVIDFTSGTLIVKVIGQGV